FTCLLFLLHAPTTTLIYTLSLHDALPISGALISPENFFDATHSKIEITILKSSPFGEICKKAIEYRQNKAEGQSPPKSIHLKSRDRKSTRLNSSHVKISYAVFCLKKKNKK